MPTVPDIHRRGTRAAQPAASAVTVGTLYFVTDEGITERSTGSAWESYSGGTPSAQLRTVTLSLDGGGVAITTGVKGYLRVPEAATITAWTLLADQTGSIVIDVWKDTFANYPPTVADTITASAKPTLSSAASGESSTLTGWTTAISAGDVLGFNVDSVSTVTRVTLQLTLS